MASADAALQRMHVFGGRWVKTTTELKKTKLTLKQQIQEVATKPVQTCVLASLDLASLTQEDAV